MCGEEAAADGSSHAAAELAGLADAGGREHVAQAAHLGDLHADGIDDPMGRELERAGRRERTFIRFDADGHAACDLRQPIEVARRHRLLHHVHVVFTDAGHESDGVLGEIRHVRVDHEADLLARRLAHLAHARHVLADVAADLELQRAIAFVDARLGLLRHARGILEREHAADGDLDVDAPAKQLMQRNLEQVCGQVVERAVDAGLRDLIALQCFVDEAERALDVECVAADHEREQAVQGGLDPRIGGTEMGEGRRIAIADGPILGLERDDARIPFRIGAAGEFPFRVFVRQAHWEDGVACDLAH